MITNSILSLGILGLLLRTNAGVAFHLAGSGVARIIIHDFHDIGFLALAREFSQVVESFRLFRLQLAGGTNDFYLFGKLVNSDQGHDLVRDALSDDEEARAAIHFVDRTLGSQ